MKTDEEPVSANNQNSQLEFPFFSPDREEQNKRKNKEPFQKKKDN
jgi:hypothetical protein